MFFMHGLEHVKESHRRFRQVAQSRESWRQTRLKLELANPGLHITLYVFIDLALVLVGFV